MRTLAELVCDDDCPVRRSMDVLGGRWTLLIVRDLLVEPRRFGELLITLGGVSPKVLTERLRSLERESIVTRTVYPVMPLRVEYALTDLGRELRPVIDALAAWGSRLPVDADGPEGVKGDGTAKAPVERDPAHPSKGLSPSRTEGARRRTECTPRRDDPPRRTG